MSVIADNGKIIYDNSLDSLPGNNHIGREEIREALAAGSGYTVRRHSESTGDYYFYSATKGDGGYMQLGNALRELLPFQLLLRLFRPGSPLEQADHS